jgi:hypothetical protein
MPFQQLQGIEPVAGIRAVVGNDDLDYISIQVEWKENYLEE